LVEVTVELVSVEEEELVVVELGAGRHWKNPDNDAE
jgi:hypothetical protein